MLDPVPAPATIEHMRLSKRAILPSPGSTENRVPSTSKLTRNELEFLIEPQVRQFCGPIFFTLSLKSALGNVTNNGSFGLVDTGSKKLLVTCHHVWKEFQERRR